MNVRRAEESDAPLLARVHVDSWHAAYRGLVPDSFLESFTYQRRVQRFRESLATGSEETYVVEQNGNVMGFVMLGACRDLDLNPHCTGEIRGIYISPDYWRQGLGKRLLEEAQRLLESRQYREAVLWVLEGNEQARGFYEAMGFTLDGGTKHVDLGAPLKAVRYRKTLRPTEQGAVDHTTECVPDRHST